MAQNSSEDRIDAVAPGDLIEVDRGEGLTSYRVVHRDDVTRDGQNAVLITLETDDGETFDVEFAADAVVTRSLEAKWESQQAGQGPNPPQ